MKEIKTKDTGKAAPRNADKSSELSSRMKRRLIRAKDNLKNLADDGQVTPEEYAEDKVKYASEDSADEVTHDSKETVKKSYDRSKRLIQQIKQKRQSGETIKQTEKSTGTNCPKQRQTDTALAIMISAGVKCSDLSFSASAKRLALHSIIKA